jgi:YidC/Oxa1 family membrane protein insertase
MQYLPVAFAFFQIFFLTGLVIYYAAQALLRIGQQAYITRRYYGHDEALGRQAQRAGEQARELAKQDGGGGGMFAQARRDLNSAKGGGGTSPAPKGGKPDKAGKDGAAPPVAATSRTGGGSKRTTAPKNRPTPSGKGATGRPRSSPPSGRPGGSRAKSGGKRRR